MKRQLTPAERLIVAADFRSPEGIDCIFDKVSDLAHQLKDTGVIIKVNSALRLCGYTLITQIHDCGCKVFADLKLYDISETLATDGEFLRRYKPELLTVAAVSGVEGMKRLKAELPDTEILGVSVLTTFTDDDSRASFSLPVVDAVRHLGSLARDAYLGGLIMSAQESLILNEEFGTFMTINTPAIRPNRAIVPGDDQNRARVMTPAKAIRAGADRIVVGRPITQAANPYDAAMRTIDEIAAACEEMKV